MLNPRRRRYAAVTPLSERAEPCLGRFVAHELDHVTSVPGDTVDQFETNGAGVGIGDLDVACATCHHPLLGGGDGLPVSIGVGAVDADLLGPGRIHVSGQANVPRNAPTTFNIGLWDQTLFHDGRAQSLGKTLGSNGVGGLGIRTPDSTYGLPDPMAGGDLVAAQSRFPVTSREEMRGWTFEAHRPNAFVRSHLRARLGDFGAGAGELGQTG